MAGLFPKADYKDSQRYEQLTSYFPTFAKELQKTGYTLQTLWDGYLANHPDGYRYTQFVHYFRQWSGKTKASGILHHKAGEKLFMDFAGKTLSWQDRQTGEIHPVQVFVAVLPCSQYTYVQAVKSQKREDLVGAINGCLQWMGGVPKALVSDNLKSAVSKGHKYAPLPPGPYQRRYYKRAKVQKISHIFLSANKNYYSVPHRHRMGRTPTAENCRTDETSGLQPAGCPQ